MSAIFAERSRVPLPKAMGRTFPLSSSGARTTSASGREGFLNMKGQAQAGEALISLRGLR